MAQLWYRLGVHCLQYLHRDYPVLSVPGQEMEHQRLQYPLSVWKEGCKAVSLEEAKASGAWIAALSTLHDLVVWL